MIERWLDSLPARELDGLAVVLALCGLVAPSFMLPFGLGLLVVAGVARRRRFDVGYPWTEIPAGVIGLAYVVGGVSALTRLGGPDWAQLGHLAPVLVYALTVWFVIAVGLRFRPPDVDR
jgi:hypothetical protein